jgi:hypothetical protein
MTARRSSHTGGKRGSATVGAARRDSDLGSRRAGPLARTSSAFPSEVAHRSSTLAIAAMVFQFLVVAGTPKISSSLPR